MATFLYNMIRTNQANTLYPEKITEDNTSNF